MELTPWHPELDGVIESLRERISSSRLSEADQRFYGRRDYADIRQ
jgi:hypothetical protein